MKRAAIVADCELVFVEESPEDDLTFRVQRAVESDVKRREIEKSRAALEQRAEQGHDQGRPPHGLVYDDAGEHWMPNCESRSSPKPSTSSATAKTASPGETSAKKMGVSKNTAHRIWERYLHEASVEG